jgi:pilus assembly protein CpaE
LFKKREAGPEAKVTDRIRVLIVDDIADTRTNLGRVIGFEDDMGVVGMAKDGIEAILRAESVRPDVVLMNVCMPKMNGLVATELLTRERHHPTVVMSSVQGSQEYLRRALLARAYDYLVRPMSVEELLDAIRRAGRHNSVRNPERTPFALSPELRSWLIREKSWGWRSP